MNACFPDGALLRVDRCQITARETTARETMRVHSKKRPARASVTVSHGTWREFVRRERPHVPL